LISTCCIHILKCHTGPHSISNYYVFFKTFFNVEGDGNENYSHLIIVHYTHVSNYHILLPWLCTIKIIIKRQNKSQNSQDPRGIKMTPPVDSKTWHIKGTEQRSTGTGCYNPVGASKVIIDHTFPLYSKKPFGTHTHTNTHTHTHTHTFLNKTHHIAQVGLDVVCGPLLLGP
jgi:hypothetical protein